MVAPQDTISLAEAERRQTVEASEVSEPRFSLTNFADIQPHDTGGGQIDGVLQHGSLVFFFGESSSRKTFLMLHTALSVARQVPWFGREVQGGPVIYIPAEAGKSFANRVVAYRKAHGLEDANIPFAVLNGAGSIDLCNANGDSGALIDLIRQAGLQFESDVVLIVIDTLSRAMRGGDENSSVDMGQLVANLDGIRNKTGATVIGVHHSGKDRSRGARGHSLLRAAVDTEIEVVADGVSALSTATVHKQRDLPDGESFAFGLGVVEIGQSRSGTPITSCVVRPVEGQASAQPPNSKRLSGDRLIAMEALNEVVIDHGQPVSGRRGIPDGAICVGVEKWRMEFYARKAEASADAKRKAFGRALNSLREVGVIGYRDELAWKVVKPGQPDTGRTGTTL